MEEHTMKTKAYAGKVLGGLLLISTAAKAHTVDGPAIFLTTPGGPTAPSEQFMVGPGPFALDVYMLFPDNVLTLGGGMDLTFSHDPISAAAPTVIAYQGFQFDANSAAGRFDPALSNAPVGGIGEPLLDLRALTVGNFDGLSSGRIGTLRFDAELPGTVDIMMSTSSFAGGFFATDGAALSVDFNNVTVTVVPESEAWVLMLAGMGLIGWKVRRQQVNAPVAA